MTQVEIYALPDGWTDQHLQAMCDWLRANNIEPENVPVAARVLVENDTITTTLHLRNGAGHKYIDLRTDDIAQEVREFPLLVPMADVARRLLDVVR